MKKLIITMLMTIAGLTTLMAQQTHDIKGVVIDKRNEPIEVLWLPQKVPTSVL